LIGGVLKAQSVHEDIGEDLAGKDLAAFDPAEKDSAQEMLRNGYTLNEILFSERFLFLPRVWKIWNCPMLSRRR